MNDSIGSMFDSVFPNNGPILWGGKKLLRWFELTLSEGQVARIEVVRNSKAGQAIIVSSEKSRCDLTVKELSGKRFILWASKLALEPVNVYSAQYPCKLVIWNEWITPGIGTNGGLTGNAAIWAEPDGRGSWLLRCNDAPDPVDFDALVLRVTVDAPGS